MKTRKNTKRALILSALSLLLCVSMLVGSTFAWFTDNATTAVNSIQSGTLEIGLYYDEACTKAVDETTPLKFVKAAGHEGEAVLFEPGATYNVETVYIKNEGNLAVKYIVEIAGIKGDAPLNDVIDWTITDGTSTDPKNEGHLLKGAVQAITISGTMQTTAGNDYQGLTIDGIGITVRATQDTVEYDSENNTYDAGAQYQMPMADAEDLVKLFHSMATGENVTNGVLTIELDQDYDGTDWNPELLSPYSGVTTLNIDGKGHTIYNLTNPLITGAWGGAAEINISNLTIADAKVTGDYNGLGVGAIMAYYEGGSGGLLTFNDCKVINSTVTSSGEFAGGLIGYCSKPFAVNNCSVTGSTITSGKSAGAVIGQDATTGEMDGITVTNCKINSTGTDEGKKYCGTVVGTSNAFASVYTDVTTSGNTINGVASETYYGRAYVGLSINGTQYVQ